MHKAEYLIEILVLHAFFYDRVLLALRTKRGGLFRWAGRFAETILEKERRRACPASPGGRLR